MTNGADRQSTEVTPDTWTPGRRSTLAAPDTPEQGMSVPQHASDTEPSTRRRRERNFVLACAAVTVAAITGLVLLLTGDDERATTPPPSSIEPSNDSASSPPAQMTPEDLAAEEAKSRYLEYTRVEDLIGKSGYENPELYDSVLIDPLNTQFKLAARRAPEGQRTTGDVEVVSLTVLAVELSDDPVRRYPEVRLQACLDVSGTDALDADGNSIVAPGRLDRIKSEAVLQKIPPEAFASVGDDRPSGWYVVELVQRGEPC
jgi:hypothetical protein